MDPVSRAQAGNSEQTGLKRSFGRPFVKGQSGNPNGRPKKLHVTKMFERVLAKPNNRKEIEDSILEELKRRGMAKVLLLREMAERTEGKVTQEISVDGNITLSLAETIASRRKAIELDDSES